MRWLLGVGLWVGAFLAYGQERFSSQPGDYLLDNRSGLEWERWDNGADVSFSDAEAGCTKKGMRLPELGELVDLYEAGDEERHNRKNKAPKKFRLSGSILWSSSKKDGRSGSLDMTQGEIGWSDSKKARYICVRKKRFIEKDQTVQDRELSLVWASLDSGVSVDWKEATKYCSELSLGGYDDFRLPTVNELKVSLYENKLNAKEIRVSGDWLWASESRSNDAAVFNMNTAAVDFVSQSLRTYKSGIYVLCARSRK